MGNVLCVARLELRKGHDVLLDAVASMLDDQPSIRVELIGDGPMRRTLESELRRRRLTANVALLGWLAPEQIAAKLDGCRCLVLASLAEGLPVVLMEAFARQRPVIATNVGGVSELVKHGINGLVVPAGDSARLGSALRELMDAPIDRLAEMGARGRELVESEYRSAANAGKLVAIWAESAA
jgi:glycosyltransferase involved in cell wall biosynthesis